MTTLLDEAKQQELVAAALAIRANAYAPFSHFLVGAAVLTDEGRIYTGVNVENSSYGLTICAERVAACSAVADGAKQLVAVAVVTEGGCGPCGACRQFLYEFGPEMTVILVDVANPDQHKLDKLDRLLPDGFRLDNERSA